MKNKFIDNFKYAFGISDFPIPGYLEELIIRMKIKDREDYKPNNIVVLNDLSEIQKAVVKLEGKNRIIRELSSQAIGLLYGSKFLTSPYHFSFANDIDIYTSEAVYKNNEKLHIGKVDMVFLELKDPKENSYFKFKSKRKDELSLGQKVYSFEFDENNQLKVKEGEITKIDMSKSSFWDWYCDVKKPDIWTNIQGKEGMSGSPLITDLGEIIGFLYKGNIKPPRAHCISISKILDKTKWHNCS